MRVQKKNFKLLVRQYDLVKKRLVNTDLNDIHNYFINKKILIQKNFHVMKSPAQPKKFVLLRILLNQIK